MTRSQNVVLKTMRRIFAFSVLYLSAVVAFAQSEAQIALRNLGKTLLENGVDSIKTATALKFQSQFETEVNANGPDWVNTQSLPFVSHLSSDDKTVDVFTWVMKREDESFKHYGFAYVAATKKKPARIVRFDDKSETIKNPETKNLGSKTWLGCVYYSIKDISKGKKKMFLVLGYGGHNPQVRRKVAEIISFNNVGDVQFGAPIFEKDKRKFNRVVLEFNAKATVAMKFDEKTQTLFFDYLVPIDNRYVGNPAFYGPNGSYDAFELKGQRLVFIKDADARNETEERGNRSKEVEKKLPPR